MKKKKQNGAISFLIALILCFSLVPVSPVYGAGETAMDTTTQIGTVAEPDNFSGMVIKYRIVDEEKGWIAVDLSMKNVPWARGYSARFKLDETKLIHADKNGIVMDEDFVTEVDYVPGKITAGMTTSSSLLNKENNGSVGFLENDKGVYSNKKGTTALFNVWENAFIYMDYNLKAGLSAGITNGLGITEEGYQPPANVSVPLFTVNLVTAGSTTIGGLTAKDFQIYTNEPLEFPSGIGIVTKIGTQIGQNVYFDCSEVPSMAVGADVPTGPAITLQNVPFMVQDASGAAIEGATIAITKTADHSTAATLQTSSTGSALAELEKGAYTYTASKSGYIQANGNFEVDAADLSTITVPLSPVPPLGTSHYSVKGEYNEGTQKYTAKVYLKNMVGEGGTFGLKYDPAIFTNVNFVNEAQLFSGAGGGGSDPQSDPTKGFHTFTWIASGGTGGNGGVAGGIDGTQGGDGALIATYTFDMTSADYQNVLNSDSLQVMNWLETPKGIANSELVNKEFFRADKTVSSGGFYQAYTYSTETNPDGEYLYQDMPYQFMYTHNDRHPAYFTVTVKNGSAGVKDAVVTVTKSGITDVTGTTDTDGKTKVILTDGTYTYKIDKSGYFPYPRDAEDKNSFTVSGGAVYLTPAIAPMVTYQADWNVVNGTINGASTGTAAAFSLSDFYFSVKANEGYRFAPADVSAVCSGTAVEVTFDSVEQKYKIKGDDVKGPLTMAAIMTARTYQIKATVGSGGTLNNATAEWKETKSYKEDSTVFSYKADDGKVIFSVVANGVALPELKGKTEYSHQFTDIRSDQNISVTFGTKDPETGDITPEGVIYSLSAGSYGTIHVTAPDAVVLTGSGIETVNITKGATFTANVAANAEYIIDKISANGTLIQVPDKAATYDISEQATTDTAIHATFKPVSGSGISIEHMVTASVETSGGSITPLGTTVYTAGDKPVYTVKVAANWELEKLMLDGADVKAALTTDGAYTFGALDNSHTLKAYFKEKTRTVTGSVRLINTSTSAVELTFTRDSDGKKFTTSTKGGNNYSIGLPNGTYTIATKKGGYLNYAITGCGIDVTVSGNYSINEIPLIPGDANGDGDIVSFMDAIVVSGGFGGKMKTKADINGDTVVTIDDMAYVKTNFAKEKIRISWDDFVTVTTP